MFIKGWYWFRWGEHHFLHRVGVALTSTLFDAIAISYVLMKIGKLAQYFGFGFSSSLGVDAAESKLGLALGITARNGMMRTMVVPAQN